MAGERERNLPPAGLHLLWAVIDGYPAQFVAAFSDGEVDAWWESFGEDEVRGFFMTTLDVERPEPPRYVVRRTYPDRWRIYDCEKRRSLTDRFNSRMEADAEADELNHPRPGAFAEGSTTDA